MLGGGVAPPEGPQELEEVPVLAGLRGGVRGVGQELDARPGGLRGAACLLVEAAEPGMVFLVRWVK